MCILEESCVSLINDFVVCERLTKADGHCVCSSARQKESKVFQSEQVL